MNAYEKLMREVERLIAKGRPSPRRKPAKPRLNRGGKKLSAKPRVVSAPPRHTKPAYNPPRAPAAERVELTESFAPAPTPPEVRGVISAPLYVPQLEPAQPVSVATPDWVDGRARPCRVVDPVMGPRGADLRPDVNFTGLTKIRGGGYAHRAGVILPDGELLDDWRELQHAS